MTAQRIPLPDWRDNTRGLPFASISAEGIKPRTMAEIIENQSKRDRLRPAPRKSFIDRMAQSAIEGMSDRRQIARPGERK